MIITLKEWAATAAALSPRIGEQVMCDPRVPCHACVNAVWTCALCGRTTQPEKEDG